jgi:hypothetical protein
MCYRCFPNREVGVATTRRMLLLRQNTEVRQYCIVAVQRLCLNDRVGCASYTARSYQCEFHLTISAPGSRNGNIGSIFVEKRTRALRLHSAK